MTNSERIARWFLPVSGELELGGHYQFEGFAHGVVTDCEPFRSFTVTWEGRSISWVTVRLAKDGRGSRMTLEHMVPVDDHWETHGAGAVGVGWTT